MEEKGNEIQQRGKKKNIPGKQRFVREGVEGARERWIGRDLLSHA